MVKNLLKLTICVAVFVLTVSAARGQDEPPWTYIEGGYLNVDPDDVSGSGDNWFAGGSIGFLKHFHAGGRYVNGDYGDNISLTTWNFNAGWHGLLGDKADLLFDVTWTDTEIDDVGDNGHGFAAGVRWLPINFFELDGFAYWTDLDDAGSNDSYEARVIFNIWKIGIGGSGLYSSDATSYAVFARFNFGRD